MTASQTPEALIREYLDFIGKTLPADELQLDAIKARLAAECAQRLRALSAPVSGEAVAWEPGGDHIGHKITFSPSGEHGNACLSPDEPADGVYWTLIGSGPDCDQNSLAAQIVERLNAAHPKPAGEDCFECMAPLVGPFCPECNPAIKAALGYAVDTSPAAGAVERLRAIELSDGGGGYCSAIMDVYACEPLNQFYADLRAILSTLSGGLGSRPAAQAVPTGDVGDGADQ